MRRQVRRVSDSSAPDKADSRLVRMHMEPKGSGGIEKAQGKAGLKKGLKNASGSMRKGGNGRFWSKKKSDFQVLEVQLI